MRTRDPVLVADLAAKVLLVGLLLHVVWTPELPQYQAKGMGWRLAVYPLVGLVVPLVHRWRGGPYPAVLDLCLVLPFLIDLAGNAAGFYDDVTWWDDAMHVVTWVPLVAALGLLARPLAGDDPRAVGVLALGAGALASVLWEIAEYVTFVADHPVESLSAYRDTVGDMAGSLTGSVLGAALAVVLTRREVAA
jgi:hypothetical protein